MLFIQRLKNFSHFFTQNAFWSFFQSIYWRLLHVRSFSSNIRKTSQISGVLRGAWCNTPLTRQHRYLQYVVFCVSKFEKCWQLHGFDWTSTAMHWMGVASLPRGSPLFYQLHKTAPLLTITLRHYEANSQLATHTQPQVQEPSAYWSLHFNPKKGERTNQWLCLVYCKDLLNVELIWMCWFT